MNLKSTKNVFLFLVVIVLSGCASGPKYVKPKPLDSSNSDMARVFFYRLNSIVGAAWGTTFLINKTKAMSIRSGGYSYMLVEPGIHRMHLSAVGDLNLSITTELEPGKDYFFRYSLSGGGLPKKALVASTNREENQTTYTGTHSISTSTNLQFVQVKKEYAEKELETSDYKFSKPLIAKYKN